MGAKSEYSETLEKVLVSTTLAQSRQVSVSTTPKFLVSKSLGLDNSKIPGLKESRSRQLNSSEYPYQQSNIKTVIIKRTMC